MAMESPIDLIEIVKMNELQVAEKKVLYIKLSPEATSTDLLVVMSAHNQGNKYMALRSFLEKQVCDLLFITDPNNSWYLDGDSGASFHSVLKQFTEHYQPQNVCLFGSSMSGYGAIFHAFKLNSNAVTSNPQINLNITKDYAWPELIKHINEIPGPFTNLDEVADEQWGDSAIYVIHGHDDMDIVNLQLLSRAAPKNKKLIVQTLDVETHVLYFGRHIDYIYSAMDLLSEFRTKLDLTALMPELVNSDKTNRKALRNERKNYLLADPLRDTPDKSLQSWQHRYLKEKTGTVAHFKNIGFYKNNCVIGADCTYDGKQWNVQIPPLSADSNLANENTLTLPVTIHTPQNNQFINKFWWVRNDCESRLTLSGADNVLTVNLVEPNSKNIYISTTINKDLIAKHSLQGKYLTVSAEVFCDVGEVYLTLGGVGDSGYHHKNSEKSTPGEWQALHTVEHFLSINAAHKDSIFIRFNFAPDKKPKTVRIRNIKLVAGYFPMGLQ